MDACFASLDDILALREAVIIAGTGRDSPYFPGDLDAATRHAGVFEDGACIGCATFLHSEWEGAPAWQLRGMATAQERQACGIGRILLRFAENALHNESSIGVFWCNARASACGFYQKMGWAIVSEQFDVPGIGPHYRMTKRLSGL